MEFDIVIVGAGTAGCMVAAQLAHLTGLTIGIVEAGGRYPGWALNAPLAGLRLRPFWSWRHETVELPTLMNRAVVFPMGRVVGGTSAVNAMVAAAGHPQDYAFLQGDESAGVSLDGLLKEVTERGVQIQSPRYRSGFTSAFVDACREQGLVVSDRLDGSESETCGTFQLFQRNGGRWSSAHLLRERRCRERIRVVRSTFVRTISLHGTRAVGVMADGPRGVGFIKARAGVVIAAGAIHSPCILQRSGIGPKELLEAAGIRVAADLQGVGRNLQDHVGVPWVVPSRVPTPGRPSRWLPAAVRFMISRSGVMASNCCEAGCFFGGRDSRPSIEVFTHFQSKKHPNAVEFSTILLHPQSRGEVAIDPKNPWGPPQIDPNYFSAQDDLPRLADGLARMIRIANSDALRGYGLSSSERDVEANWIRHHATTYYHPGGTCRQGNDSMGVVDRGFRVHGAESLWIADMSVVPDLPGGHTALTALVIGARAGREIATYRRVTSLS